MKADPTFITRLVLRNYRSIAGCDVVLGPLTFLVGPNGSGKSNMVDALRLISDGLRTSLDHALRDRGGIQEVRRVSYGHPTHFGIRVEFRFDDGDTGHYAFEVGAKRDGGFDVRSEECAIAAHRYTVRSGQIVKHSEQVHPPASADRLYLVSAAGLPAFRPVFDALSQMGFYNLNPDQIRALQTPDQGEILARDGRNLASVLERLAQANGSALKDRVEEYLARVVPGLEGVEAKRVAHMETIEFRQRVESAKDPWRFQAINMSDGTLRALGVLVALFQPGASNKVRLVGIEEPEAALHPAAAGVLRDCLREASRRTQVLVTSHSADLLDDPNIATEEILAVVAHDGKTELAQMDEAGRSVLKDRLYTAGELLRADQLRPDPSAVARAEPRQLRLFDDL